MSGNWRSHPGAEQVIPQLCLRSGLNTHTCPDGFRRASARFLDPKKAKEITMSVLVTQQAPDFKSPSRHADGQFKTISVSDYRDQYVLLFILSSWTSHLFARLRLSLQATG